MTEIGSFVVDREAWKYTPAQRYSSPSLPEASPVEDRRSVGAEAVVMNHLVVSGASREVHQHLVATGAGAILERCTGGADGPGRLLVRTTVAFAAGVTTLDHVVLQDEADTALHLHRIEVDVPEGATYRLTSLQLGASLARTEIVVRLARGASAYVSGLTLGDGARHVDHHVTVEHTGPNATSRQQFRSVLDGRSRGVFTGRVVVAPGADGTDASQTCKALLLSDTAVANARPQLEILADDVKCAHGAALGRPDGEVVFFLRQRGLDEAAARQLLVVGFAAEILSTVPPALAERVRASMPGWLTT